MALIIRQLGSGTINASGTADPLGDAVATAKARIIKSMRFVNTHATANATLNIYIVAAAGQKLISPSNLSLGPGQMYVDDSELTLEATHKIKVTVGSTGGPVDWVVSGVDRDVI